MQVNTVKVPLSQLCFDHFFGPCFRGYDEAGLLAFEALQGSPRPARGTRTKRGLQGLESMQCYCWGLLAMIDGRGSGTLWCLLDLQEYCRLSKLRQFWQKRSLQNLIFGAVLPLKMQGWIERVTLYTGEKFFMRGSAISKGKVAFNNPICLDFSSLSSSDILVPEPVWLHWWPGCCCHLNFGLDPFTVICVAVLCILQLPVDLKRFTQRLHFSGFVPGDSG